MVTSARYWFESQITALCAVLVSRENVVLLSDWDDRNTICRITQQLLLGFLTSMHWDISLTLLCFVEIMPSLRKWKPVYCCSWTVSPPFSRDANLCSALQEFQQAEAFLLRAQRADLAIKYYQEADMWKDVLRIAREYLPNKFEVLQAEYERKMTRKGARWALYVYYRLRKLVIEWCMCCVFGERPVWHC